jgi:DGQHR domain-containing protein
VAVAPPSEDTAKVGKPETQDGRTRVRSISAVSIPVAEGPRLRGDIGIVLGVIDAGTLSQLYTIPRRDFRRKTGYQRDVSVTRVNRIVADLRDRKIDLPTAILLNLRDFTPAKNLVRDGRVTRLVLDGSEVYVVDGQHRVEALSKLVAGDPDAWSGFQIPFVCMLGATEREEMEEFYIVNSTAKSVRTDLALDLLKQRAESNPDVMTALIERGQAWKVKSQTVVEELEKVSPVWRGRVRFPGEPQGETTIASTGLVASLRGPLGSPYFGSVTTDNQVKILDAYWQGVRRVLPDAFDNPPAFVIQKGSGVLVMHGLLVSVIELVRSKGWSVIEPGSYARALEDPLMRLEGDTAEGEVVSGADFWRSGPSGAAGTYSSNAAKRVLIAKLRALMPAMDVE